MLENTETSVPDVISGGGVALTFILREVEALGARVC